MIKLSIIFCVLITSVALPLVTQAQHDKDKTESLLNIKKFATLKSAVEATPDSLNVHMDFIEAVGVDDPELEVQYNRWIEQFPKSAMVPYAIAKAYLKEENSKAKKYLLKTVTIDSKFTEAWGGLWTDGERRGDYALSHSYLQKATESDPSNANYAFYYASSFDNKDIEKWTQLSLDVAKRFPENERGAQALYWLAIKSKKNDDKLKYFELLRNSYNLKKFGWSRFGMSSYYNILLSENPEKARTLAEEMTKIETTDEKQWPTLVSQAQTIAEVNILIKQKKGQEAKTLLKQIKLSPYSEFRTDLILLKAHADEIAGKTSVAYDSLIVNFAKSPSIRIKNVLIAYANILGKSTEQTEADIWAFIDSTAQVATPFIGLKNYLTSSNSSLSDYRGKVVLLTYWFPGCGPCRAEFPHFENVVKKFKEQDLAYLALNILSKQNDYVMPFIKATRHSFIPLEDTKKRVKGNLDNYGVAPVNYLIDKKGRVIFANFRTDGNNEEDLELMINMLMNKNSI